MVTRDSHKTTPPTFRRLADSLFLKAADRVVDKPERFFHVTTKDYRHPYVPKPGDKGHFVRDYAGPGFYGTDDKKSIDYYAMDFSYKDDAPEDSHIVRNQRIPRGARVIQLKELIDIVTSDPHHLENLLELKVTDPYIASSEDSDTDYSISFAVLARLARADATEDMYAIVIDEYGGNVPDSVIRVVDFIKAIRSFQESTMFEISEYINYVARSMGYDVIEYPSYMGSRGKDYVVINQDMLTNPRKFTIDRLGNKK